MTYPAEHTAVRVLKADPELVKHLDPRSAEVAQRHTIVPVATFPCGTFERFRVRSDTPANPLGYLILEGLLIHRIQLEGRSGIELLGPGDVITARSCESAELERSTHVEDSWEVVVPTQVAILDSDFERTVIRWPGIMAELFDRAVHRAYTLGVCLALAQMPGVERRLHTVFWMLADRWGRVTPDGVALQLRLSHKMLGELVSARRQTVTTALKSLIESGAVERRASDEWLIKGDPPEQVAGAKLDIPAAI